MTPSKILFFSSLSFIIGIFLASFIEGVGRYFPAFFILGLSLIISFIGRWKVVFPIFLLFIFIGLGAFWFNTFNNRESSFKGEELSSFKGIILKEPETRNQSTHFILSGIEEFSGEKLLLITEKHIKYGYGDILEIKGRIRAPKPFNGFDYPGYLAKDGIYLTVFHPQVKIVGHKDLFKKRIIAFKERARGYLEQGLPEPHSSIMAAMLLGDKRSLPLSWREKMSDAGVGHIMAVSGLHVMVVIAIIMAFLGSLGISRRRFIFIIIPAVLFFILMTGIQISAVRAGIMGGCLILASYFGRMNNSLRVVIIVAALMLLINPLLLRYDIGFQLSFLAVIGIIQFSSLFQKKLLFLPKIAQETTAMSFSAYILIFPVLAYYFGRISLVFMLTNFLIIPTLYIIMILGAIFIFISFFSGALAMIAFLPLWILTTYIISVIHFFSGIPWGVLKINSISPLIIIIFYFSLFLISSRKKRKNSIE